MAIFGGNIFAAAVENKVHMNGYANIVIGNARNSVESSDSGVTHSTTPFSV
jgi:hypothetical protein